MTLRFMIEVLVSVLAFSVALDSWLKAGQLQFSFLKLKGMIRQFSTNRAVTEFTP